MSEVSVVIPVRDGERYLGEAIESALGQTFAPTEIVVIDDGSTDSSASVAADYGPRVRVVSQPPSGIAAAINRGVAESGAELVAMLDADDLWPEAKLELQTSQLAASAELDAVFGHVQFFLSPDLDADERASLVERPDPGPFRAKGTMLIHREALKRFGAFDPRLNVGDFIDWYARAEEAGLRSRMYSDVVLHRRLHASNFGRSEQADHLDYVRIVRAALRRRQGQAG